MMDRACERDVEGFFNYVDKDSVVKSMEGGMQEKADAMEASSEGDEKSVEMARKLMKGMTSLVWMAYEVDIKRGNQSSFCQMDIVDEEKTAGGGTVTIELPNGLQQKWGFSKTGDAYTLVSIES